VPLPFARCVCDIGTGIVDGDHNRSAASGKQPHQTIDWASPPCFRHHWGGAAQFAQCVCASTARGSRFWIAYTRRGLGVILVAINTGAERSTLRHHGA
jgi:hypothetical protein